MPRTFSRNKKKLSGLLVTDKTEKAFFGKKLKKTEFSEKHEAYLNLQKNDADI